MQFSAIKFLQKHRLKATKTRCFIINTLHQTQSHLNADDFYALATKHFPKVGISSIYRNLSQLEESQAIIKHLFQNSYTYELNLGDHHDHLICVKCNKILEFIDHEIEKKQILVAKKHNFTILSHTLNLYGICEECQS